jgi:hypothetical protein
MKTESPFDKLFQTLADINNPNSSLHKPAAWVDRVAKEKPLSECRINKMGFEPLKHSHGTNWDSCEICNSEIIEGKEIYIEHAKMTCKESVIYNQGEVVIHHVCQTCFDEPGFTEWLSGEKIKQIKNY